MGKRIKVEPKPRVSTREQVRASLPKKSTHHYLSEDFIASEVALGSKRHICILQGIEDTIIQIWERFSIEISYEGVLGLVHHILQYPEGKFERTIHANMHKFSPYEVQLAVNLLKTLR